MEGSRGGWSSKKYQLPKKLSFYLEAVLAAYFIACFVLAIHFQMWLSIPFLYLFLHGYSHMFLLGLGGGKKLG